MPMESALMESQIWHPIDYGVILPVSWKFLERCGKKSYHSNMAINQNSEHEFAQRGNKTNASHVKAPASPSSALRQKGSKSGLVTWHQDRGAVIRPPIRKNLGEHIPNRQEVPVAW